MQVLAYGNYFKCLSKSIFSSLDAFHTHNQDLSPPSVVQWCVFDCTCGSKDTDCQHFLGKNAPGVEFIDNNRCCIVNRSEGQSMPIKCYVWSVMAASTLYTNTQSCLDTHTHTCTNLFPCSVSSDFHCSALKRQLAASRTARCPLT